MARPKRIKSPSGIYHVIMRGINKQLIFESDEDYSKFIKILNQVKKTTEMNLYAYCLMSNHIHLLIGETSESISQIMKRISDRFVIWYNKKYQRTGSLFQDRFRSEIIDSDKRFLITARYIFQNPIKAGITKKVDDYPYTNYFDYLSDANSITSTDEIMSFFHTNELFSAFMNCDTEEECMEISNESRKYYTDETALKIINEMKPEINLKSLMYYPRNERNSLLYDLKQLGLSTRQISRLTGISKSIVANAKK